MSEVITELNDPVMIFVLGIAGGFLAELGRWYNLRESPRLPIYIRSAVYWTTTILMILAGGVVAYVYGEVGTINALLAVNVGAAAPLIISGLVRTPPKPPPERAPEFDTRSKLREFLSWR